MRHFFTLLFFAFSLSSYCQQLSLQKNISYGGSVNAAKCIITDDNGNIYVSGGFSSDGPGASITGGIFLEKYDAGGNLLWYDTVMAAHTTVISLNMYNNVIYLIGRSSGYIDNVLNFDGYSLFKPSTAYNAAFFAKYDLNGNVQAATIELNASPIQTEIFNNILYLLGGSSPCGAVLKTYDSNFTQLSSACLGSIPHLLDMAVVDESNIYVCKGGGASSEHGLRKYDSAGNLAWNIPTSTFSYDIDVDSLGHCYIAGASGGRVRKYDSAGGLLGDCYPPDYNIVKKIYWSGNDMYVTGYDSAKDGLTLVKYTNDTLKYSFFIGNYSPIDIAKHGSDVYMTLQGNDMYQGAYFIKISEEEVIAGIMEPASNSSFSIYPNPTQSVFTISYSAVEKDHLQLKVINSKGQVICTESQNNFQGEYRKQMDLSKYARGVYSIEIIHGKTKEVKRVIVN